MTYSDSERNYRRSFLFTKIICTRRYGGRRYRGRISREILEIIPITRGRDLRNSSTTILKNKALDYLRHKVIHESAIENIMELNDRELNIRISTLEACDPEEIFSHEIQTIIHNTLQSLPEQTRRIFEMSRFENKTVKEIAEETNITAKE